MDIGSGSSKEKKVAIIIVAGIVLLFASLFGQSTGVVNNPNPPTLTVSPTSAAGGDTVTWSGTATPGVAVELWNSNATGTALATATADSSGNYSGTWVVAYPSGANSITVLAYDTFSKLTSGNVTISTASSPVASVVTRVYPVKGEITGTVRDVNGKALANITVAFGSHNTPTGTFTRLGVASSDALGLATFKHAISTTLYYRASAGGVQGNAVKG